MRRLGHSADTNAGRHPAVRTHVVPEPPRLGLVELSHDTSVTCELREEPLVRRALGRRRCLRPRLARVVTEARDVLLLGGPFLLGLLLALGRRVPLPELRTAGAALLPTPPP